MVAHFWRLILSSSKFLVPTLKPLHKAHNAPALQLFPDDYDTDGFFIASLIRRK
ncbi:16S rRNA methyltransferase B [Lacticaseibacillus paracasei subsp. paracasei Lpp7]|uniref:16S rRNA methyltransferase B n=1 Tax=Lacticaseibacillus paracasei subsp. paracasei Lpp7 TaxID=1256200 RepID=A0A8E0IDU2_LACPA|nr:16S rRNA methyltransferase B [Lacticaseibacillus paracasei subsp. paracasei Lpp7]